MTDDHYKHRSIDRNLYFLDFLSLKIAFKSFGGNRAFYSLVYASFRPSPSKYLAHFVSLLFVVGFFLHFLVPQSNFSFYIFPSSSCLTLYGTFWLFSSYYDDYYDDYDSYFVFFPCLRLSFSRFSSFSCHTNANRG